MQTKLSEQTNQPSGTVGASPGPSANVSSDPMQVIFLVTLLAVFGVLFKCAWRPKVKARDALRAGQSGELGEDVARNDSGAVPDAATATNFQLLSVVPNVTFGFQHLLAIPVANVIGFLLGNVLTAKYLKNLLAAISEFKSPHTFIASAHGVPQLRRFTALVSLFVFLGVTCFELTFLARISQTLVGGGDATFNLFFFMLGLAIIFVSAVGEQRMTLAADKLLLVIAYVGIHAAIALLVLSAPAQLDLATLFVVVLLGGMLFLRIRSFAKLAGSGKLRHGVIAASALALFASLVWFLLFRTPWTGAQLVNAGDQLLPDGNGMNAWTYGVALAACLCGAVFYNFVDFSFWQKYLSEVRPGEDISSLAGRVTEPFWKYAIEAPLSWLLPVVLGLYAVGALTEDSAVNPIPAAIQFMSRSSWAGTVVAVSFYAAVVAIAISTACGYLVSSAYLVQHDLVQPKGSVSDSPVTRIVVGIGVLALFLGLNVFEVIPIEGLIVLMLASFAPLCALTPLIMWPIIKGTQSLKLKPWCRVGLMMTTGLSGAAGLAVGVSAAVLQLSPDSAIYWLPMPISFVAAWTFYAALIGLGREPVEVPLSAGNA